MVFMVSMAVSNEYTKRTRPADVDVANKKTDGYLFEYNSTSYCVRADTFASNQLVLVVAQCPDGHFLEYGFKMHGDIVDKVFRHTTDQRITSKELVYWFGVPPAEAEAVLAMRPQSRKE
jgi:hypothetical protein